MRDIDISSSRPEPAAPAPGLVPDVTRLISGRVLARNAVWNLIGVASPALVAIVCLPILKRALGTDRLGVISLAWVVVGYFSVFDFGLSRALTKLVSEKLGSRQTAEITPLIWTALFLMTGLGLIGGLAAFFLSPWIVRTFVKVPPELHRETLQSFYWLCLSIPIVIITAGLRGVLEALQRFRIATAIRVPLGMFTFLGPVLVLSFSHSLVAIVAVLTVGRGLAGIAHLWACFHAWPGLRNECRFRSGLVGSMLHFGGWMTVTNLVGPMMVTFDRFLLGAFVSVSAVAYYAVPSEMVNRLLLFPITLTGVLFPAFSTAHAADRERLSFLFESTLKFVFIILFPVILVLVALAPELLRIWLGIDFAQNSATVLRYLAVAVFIGSLAQVPFAYLQGVGRPDITAKLHLIELPLYFALLFTLVQWFGIRGAAIAWLLRVSLDALLLFWFSFRRLPRSEFLKTRFPLLGAGGLLVVAVTTWHFGLISKLFLVTGMCAAFLPVAWFQILSPRERSSVQAQIARK